MNGGYRPEVGGSVEGDDGVYASEKDLYRDAFRAYAARPEFQPGSPQRRDLSSAWRNLPGFGTIISAYGAATGKDLVSGECEDLWTRTTDGLSTAGAILDVAGSRGRTTERPTPTREFEVGEYDDLAYRARGLGMQIHHIPQSKLGVGAIDGYRHSKGLAIALYKGMHTALPVTSRLKGDYSNITPTELRMLISQQLRDLKNARMPNDLLNQSRVPKETLREIGHLMRQRYPRIYR